MNKANLIIILSFFAMVYLFSVVLKALLAAAF